MVIEKRIDKRLPKISLVVFHTQWHLKGKLRSIYLGSFMNHRLSFQSNQRGFRIRCKHPQRGHQYQADWWPVFHEQDFEVSAIESQRARKNISCDVQLRTTIYVYIYMCNSKVRSICRFTYIYPIFVPSWQAAGHLREMMWTRNLNFRNVVLFFLTIYLRSTPCLMSSLSIVVLIFIKIHHHQKTLKTKDVRLLTIYTV